MVETIAGWVEGRGVELWSSGVGAARSGEGGNAAVVAPRTIACRISCELATRVS